MQTTTSYSTGDCPNCGHPMVLQDHVNQYCDQCATTLVAIGTIDLREYRCGVATMSEITAAVIADLVAHGFTNLLIKPFPHDPTDLRLIIWGQHFDPAIHELIAGLSYREQLYVYWYRNGEILRDGDGMRIVPYPNTDYRRNDYTFSVIYSAIHRWMKTQGTQEVRNEWSIYKTTKYYEFQRKVKREQRRNGCATNLNSIRAYVDAIASQATKIERLIADYNTEFGEQLPVKYTEIQMPTIPNQR